MYTVYIFVFIQSSSSIIGRLFGLLLPESKSDDSSSKPNMRGDAEGLLLGAPNVNLFWSTTKFSKEDLEAL
jgi:hypothetical protein